MLAEIAQLEAELEAERGRGVKTVETLGRERDQTRRDLHAVQASLAVSEGALEESRRQAEREEKRNRELSDRVIAEAAKALALARRIEELERDQRL